MPANVTATTVGVPITTAGVEGSRRSALSTETNWLRLAALDWVAVSHTDTKSWANELTTADLFTTVRAGPMTSVGAPKNTCHNTLRPARVANAITVHRPTVRPIRSPLPRRVRHVLLIFIAAPHGYWRPPKRR